MKFDDASRSDMAINSIIKLASFLQRALDKGRSNYIEMGEVSKYVNYMIRTNTHESLRYIELMLENDRCKRIKRLRNDLFALFNELLEHKAVYENLILPNGRIDRNKLALLIELDTNIIDALKGLKNMLSVVKDRCEITLDEETEIRKLASEIEKGIIKKKDII
ncbi:MAG: hypothetical protein KatS3mg003_1113 [Candidatus Nitrosocaldaceae archaeon]|nr:MAG: hypothetical protein KatS3mg003_1113 [Candidatus Nitrosocaldaceae archaeon]